MTIAVLFGSLLILIFLSVPIGFSIGIATLITIVFTTDDIQLLTITQKAFTALDSFPLMAIPFFIFAGVLMGKGGVSKRLLDFANALVGFMVGGLATVTVLACMFFAAISGSGPATVAAVGSFMIPAMNEKKYGLGFSSALTATAGSLGAIIPPSISFILLGVTSGLSISSLFLAGVLPGVFIGLLLMVTSYFVIRSKKATYSVSESDGKFHLKHVWETFRKAVWALFTPIIVLGGIYAGFFTPTESAAVAIGYAFIIGMFVYKDLQWKDIYDSCVETIKISGAILYMIGLSVAFAYVLTIERVPEKIAELMLSISDNAIIILLLINLFLLLVGAFIDTVAAIVILSPILLPVATEIGLDPIHFGVILILNLTIGYITPPVGVNLFVASAIGKVPFEQIVRAVIPLFIVMVVGLMVVSYVPQLSLLLPRLFG